jgi:hypothetical protein
MHPLRTFAVVTALLLFASPAPAGLIVEYIHDYGGTNTDPLNGLSARGTFSIDGTELTILLENTSTGVPAGFEASDSLVVSLGMNLPDGIVIGSGDSALIGPGSVGVGAWAALGAGESVAEQWIWTNDSGGDLLEAFTQVISTSVGQGGGTLTGFDGQPGDVNGPFGGIAASPPIVSIPGSKKAVSDSIKFTLTLSGALSDTQLELVASKSRVEFGSDVRYLGAPEPASLALLGLGGLLVRRRR